MSCTLVPPSTGKKAETCEKRISLPPRKRSAACCEAMAPAVEA